MRNAIIVGANSTIANAVINKLAGTGYNLFLLARSDLSVMMTDIKIKNPDIDVTGYYYAAEADNDVGNTLEQIYAKAGTIDLVLVAHGNLPDQEKCNDSWQEFDSALTINGISVIKICHSVALKMKQQQHGTIAVISSVAGMRGRQSNYAYGTAKGMLNIYLQGLRNEMFKYKVHVLTILPGFVDTKMTRDFKKGFLWASPEKVAFDIVNAINKKKNLIYTPWFWKYIMFIITSIPECKFKTMKL